MMQGWSIKFGFCKVGVIVKWRKCKMLVFVYFSFMPFFAVLLFLGGFALSRVYFGNTYYTVSVKALGYDQNNASAHLCNTPVYVKCYCCISDI